MAIKKKRYKPSLQSLCEIGTIAHNRPFNARDMREYSHSDDDAQEVPMRIKWLIKHKLIQPVDKGRTYFPTAKGWKMIERACSVRSKSRRYP